MFDSVLVANRGEIAVRICRTLREMGIRSVVAASIPDRRSLAVRTADDRVLLEGYSAAESYLDIEAIIAAAKEKGCQAIHPGYGFLSERADFAERCDAEGITFIGPPPAVLRALGDKSSARQLAVASGVAVVPGYDGPDDEASLLREAARIGAPLMVKARGGGGGRGMREVHDLAELPEALASARREARSAFGDPGLLLEKLVTDAHHVEVQILADAHGNVIHLGERDCSVQRRRQKLIEETPSPIVDEPLRARLADAALRIVRAAGYVNAGTVEFLVETPADGAAPEYYFLEVNPRLQVEHPVTEMVTGVDLVELQVRIAAGEPLPMKQEEVTFTGHAIEIRVNAEDPWDDFKPSSGAIERSWLDDERVGNGDDGAVQRLDTGYEAGDVVPREYDSLLAKVVCWAPTRKHAIDMASRWAPDDVWGLRTNLGLVGRVLQSDDFQAGRAHIGWLHGRLESFRAEATPDAQQFMAAAAGFSAARDIHWLGAGPTAVWMDDGQCVAPVTVKWTGASCGTVAALGETAAFAVAVLGPDGEGTPVRVTLDGAGHTVFVNKQPQGTVTVSGLGIGDVRVVAAPPLPRRAVTASAGATAITSPLPGTVAAVRVAEGDTVEPGQLLLLLEAMKMEHRITATASGTVKRVAVRHGDQVREGDLLIEVG